MKNQLTWLVVRLALHAFLIGALAIAACILPKTGRAETNEVIKGNVKSDAADAEGIIFERQLIMTELEENADLLGNIVAGEIPPDSMLETSLAIAKGAREAFASFQSSVPGGRSKPEVWANWPDFSQRMEAFVRNADEMAKVAQAGDVVAVTSILGEALPCKQCHDVYRAPKKNYAAERIDCREEQHEQYSMEKSY